MKYLVCQRMDVEQPGDWAEDGDAVIPNFPTGPLNTFLSLVSFKPAYYARVADLPDMSLDATLTALKARYPGLPHEMLATYLLETATVAAKEPVGAILQSFATYDETKLAVKGSDNIYTLWTEQPIPNRLKL